MNPALSPPTSRQDVTPTPTDRERDLSIPRLVRLAGLVCVVAALLMAASDLVWVTLHMSDQAATLASPAFSAFTVPKLIGTLLLLMGLVGLYLRQSVAAGRLGLVGFLIAFTGTALVAGDWWFEAFAVPWLMDLAPDVATASGSGTLLVGASVSFALFSLGWMLFGLATFRARVFPRWSVVLLIVGGALSYGVGMPPFGLGLAVAVGILGVLSYELDEPTPEGSHARVLVRGQAGVDLDAAGTGG